MHAITNPILSLCLCALALISFPGLSEDAGGSLPDVRAVLFYDPGSSQSRELFAFYLPGLYERYGDRLQISGIDLSQPAGKRAYTAAAKRLGLPPQPDEEPAVVVGNRAIVGLFSIVTTFGDDFENLAADPRAQSWPPDPALEGLLGSGIEIVKARIANERALSAGGNPEQGPAGKLPMPTRDQIANGLAVVILLGMVAALVHSLVRVRRRHVTRPVASGGLLITLLAGLAISGYTAYTALAEVELMCGPIGGCTAIQESGYSKFLGVPMGVIGLVGYSLILVTWLIARRLSPQGGGWFWLPWAVALFGVLVSLYLTALEPFVIGAICLWCLGSAASITIALWLLSGYTRKGAEP
jgi:uncharacterized membrane protein